jgi:hypothetical protein
MRVKAGVTALLLFAVLATAVSRQQGTTVLAHTITQAEVDQLVRDLGDDSYFVRRTAVASLEREAFESQANVELIGSSLKAARASTDLEVVTRVREIEDAIAFQVKSLSCWRGTDGKYRVSVDLIAYDADKMRSLKVSNTYPNNPTRFVEINKEFPQGNEPAYDRIKLNGEPTLFSSPPEFLQVDVTDSAGNERSRSFPLNCSNEVGGIVVDPNLGALALQPGASSGSAAWLVLTGGLAAAAAGAIALGGGAWHVRRRNVR